MLVTGPFTESLPCLNFRDRVKTHLKFWCDPKEQAVRESINDSAISIMRGTSTVPASGFTIKNQDVLNISTTNSSGEASIHLYESIQSAEIMAAGFHKDLPKASIQTRTEIQEESKAKVGTAEMDEGC